MAVMLFGGNPDARVFQHHVAIRRIFHDAGAGREEPGFVDIGEARIGRLHHDADLAVMAIELGGQFVFAERNRGIGADVRKAVAPALVDRGRIRHRQGDGEARAAGNADDFADLPVDGGLGGKRIALEVRRDRNRQRQKDFVAIGESHQAGIEERRPFGNRPDDVADVVFRHARGQLPVARAGSLAAVAAELPIGMPVLDRIETDAKPQGLARNRGRGFGDEFDFDLLGAVHLGLEADAGKAQHEQGGEPGQGFRHHFSPVLQCA